MFYSLNDLNKDFDIDFDLQVEDPIGDAASKS